MLPLTYMGEDCASDPENGSEFSQLYLFWISFLVRCQNNGIIPALNKMLAVLHVGTQETENHFPSKHHETNFHKYDSQGTHFSFSKSSWTSFLMNCATQLNFIMQKTRSAPKFHLLILSTGNKLLRNSAFFA